MYAITDFGATKINNFCFWVGHQYHTKTASPKTYQEFLKNKLAGSKTILNYKGDVYATRETPLYSNGDKGILSIHLTPPENINIGVCPDRTSKDQPAFFVSHSHGSKFFRTRSGAEVYAKYLNQWEKS